MVAFDLMGQSPSERLWFCLRAHRPLTLLALAVPSHTRNTSWARLGQALRATVRGVFALVAAVLLWLSIGLLVLVSGRKSGKRGRPICLREFEGRTE